MNSFQNRNRSPIAAIMNNNDEKRDIPYDFCEICLNEIETEDDVIRYGDFNFCSEKCKDEFQNLLASQQPKRHFEEYFEALNKLKIEHFKSFSQFNKDFLEGKE